MPTREVWGVHGGRPPDGRAAEESHVLAISGFALPSFVPFLTPGFTLIEVLVVVAVVSLLITMLVPSLTRAREQTRMVTCKSSLHQIGAAIEAYAHEHRGVIPHGPAVKALGTVLEANDGELATNQIWTGPQDPAMGYMALGLLMNRALAYPELMYCPADDSSDPHEELGKVRGRRAEPGYCSFLYRQLDESDRRGKIENLGVNAKGGRAKALALDMNSVVTVDPAWRRTNHQARRVNVLYADGCVLTFDNGGHPFSLRDQDLMDTAGRRDVILQNADAGYHGRRP